MDWQKHQIDLDVEGAHFGSVGLWTCRNRSQKFWCGTVAAPSTLMSSAPCQTRSPKSWFSIEANGFH